MQMRQRIYSLLECVLSKRVLLCMLYSMFCIAMVSAETIIVGHVFDSRTGENLPNVNVFFRGTKVGCSTNEEGLFMVRGDFAKTQTLVVSAVGYKTQKYKIEPDQYLGLEVELEEKTLALDEFFVLPGENPALAIMEQVRAHAAENDVSKNTAVCYTVNEDKSLFISDIQQRHLQRKLWKSLQQGMLVAEDSTYLFPLYQSLGDYQRAGKESRLLAPATERTTFLTETDYQVLLNGLPQQINFYDNTITIFGKSFVSPLASFGSQYYKYYLEELDTVEQDNYQLSIINYPLVKVRFTTKNPFIPTFNGEMLIDTTTYALRSIQVMVPREININYLASLQLQQDYSSANTLANEHLSMIFDFAIKADTTRTFPTILLQRTLNAEPSPLRLPHEGERSQPTQVQSIPHQGGTEGGLSIDSLPLIQWTKWFAYIFNTGEVPMGNSKVNVGNIAHIIGGSTYEGLRLGLPFATNEKLWKNVRLNGYLAYGFRDRKVKGQAQLQVKLPTARRHILGTYYWDRFVDTDISDIDIALRENSILTGEMDFTYRVFRGVNSYDVLNRDGARKREFKVFSKNEWSDVVETDFAFQMGRMDLVHNNVWNQSYRYRALTAGVRLGWQEKKIDLHFRRHYLYSHYPVVRAFAEFGSYEYLPQSSIQRPASSVQLYGKLTLAVQQSIPLGVCGHLDYMAEAGMVLGEVPYPLLKTFAGNQSWMFDSYRFSLMPLNQQRADKYVLLHAHWDMEGVLFNRIPGLRYLRLHELLELKVAWGGAVPYLEAGIGIGNVLRCGDFYFVSRLTNFQDTTAPIMGFRFRFRLGL